MLKWNRLKSDTSHSEELWEFIQTQTIMDAASGFEAESRNRELLQVKKVSYFQYFKIFEKENMSANEIIIAQ